MTKPLTIDTTIEEIIENFSYLDEWEDRYGYLIELGKALTPMPEHEMTDANKVNGCVSQVWLSNEAVDGRIHLLGASDAHIVRGLVAITLCMLSGKTAADILGTDVEGKFGEIGLTEHITPQRANGLRSMVARIREIAANAA